jgi:hypothetical protein
VHCLSKLSGLEPNTASAKLHFMSMMARELASPYISFLTRTHGAIPRGQRARRAAVAKLGLDGEQHGLIAAARYRGHHQDGEAEHT